MDCKWWWIPPLREQAELFDMGMDVFDELMPVDACLSILATAHEGDYSLEMLESALASADLELFRPSPDSRGYMREHHMLFALLHSFGRCSAQVLTLFCNAVPLLPPAFTPHAWKPSTALWWLPCASMAG